MKILLRFVVVLEQQHRSAGIAGTVCMRRIRQPQIVADRGVGTAWSIHGTLQLNAPAVPAIPHKCSLMNSILVGRTITPCLPAGNSTVRRRCRSRAGSPGASGSTAVGVAAGAGLQQHVAFDENVDCLRTEDGLAVMSVSGAIVGPPQDAKRHWKFLPQRAERVVQQWAALSGFWLASAVSAASCLKGRPRDWPTP